MLYRLLVSGLVSGAFAGVVVTVFHFLLVEPLIFAAEQYEGAGPAIQAVAPITSHSDPNGLTHTHAGGTAAHQHNAEGGAVHVHSDGSAHVHEAWEPADGFQRGGLTLVANILIGIAFGMLLATALTLYGRDISLQKGAMWGIAGYLSFTFLPALGLPPETPGAAAGDLIDRQVWWLATAAASAVGLALLAFGRITLWKPVGLVLLVVPHVIGAPRPPEGAVGLVPPELAAHYVVNTLFSGAVLWVVLGMTMAYVLQRLDANQESTEPVS